jgi:hypothetical protein
LIAWAIEKSDDKVLILQPSSELLEQNYNKQHKPSSSIIRINCFAFNQLLLPLQKHPSRCGAFFQRIEFKNLKDVRITMSQFRRL